MLARALRSRDELVERLRLESLSSGRSPRWCFHAASRRGMLCVVPVRTKRWNDPPEVEEGYRLLICRYRPLPSARSPAGRGDVGRLVQGARAE